MKGNYYWKDPFLNEFHDSGREGTAISDPTFVAAIASTWCLKTGDLGGMNRITEPSTNHRCYTL